MNHGGWQARLPSSSKHRVRTTTTTSAASRLSTFPPHYHLPFPLSSSVECLSHSAGATPTEGIIFEAVPGWQLAVGQSQDLCGSSMTTASSWCSWRSAESSEKSMRALALLPTQRLVFEARRTSEVASLPQAVPRRKTLLRGDESAVSWKSRTISCPADLVGS